MDREAIDKAKEEIERKERELATVVPETPVAAEELSPDEIEKLYKAAYALYGEGKYREGKSKMVRAYAAFELLPVKDKATRVRHLRLLCNISFQLQENDKTIEYAIEVLTHATDEDDKEFANASLGNAYHHKGEYDKAIGYHEKALAIYLKTLGPEHPHVGTTYVNLGAAYAEKGDKPKALEYLLKAKEIRVKKLGADHPRTKLVQSWIDGINSLK